MNINEFKYQEEWKYITNACLNLTDDCNLKCKYCFVQQKPNYMSYEIAKQAIDFIYNNLKIKKEKYDFNEKSTITFFGGEPTLLWDKIIVPISKYIRENYPNDFIINMTTNGTLLNEERIKILKEYDIQCLLSLDGDRETQNYNRPTKDTTTTSFDLVSKNLNKLKEYFPKISMRATIYQDTVGELFNNYIFAIKNGFQYCNFIPNERDPWTDEQLEILNNEIKKIYYYNLQYFLKFNKFPINYGTFQHSLLEVYKTFFNLNKEENIKNLKKKSKYKINRCGLGITGCSIGYNGKIYGCQEQPSRDDTNDLFYIGDIFNGIQENRHSNLLKKYYYSGEIKSQDINKCKDCKRINVCLSDICPSVSLDLFKDFSVASLVHCTYMNAHFNNALTILKILSDNYEKQLKEIIFCIYKEYGGQFESVIG